MPSDSRAAMPALSDYPSELRQSSQKGGLRVRHGEARTGEDPLVSIVTVVRNGVSTLSRTVQSVLAQDYPRVEYIVVDGESTDGTLDLLRSYEDRLALWVSEPDAGISDAFNKGIALARGDIIGLLNSDDWYEPDAIRSAVAAMQHSGADIACGKLQYWEADRNTYLVTSDPELLESGMTVGHPTVFARRTCYARIGLYRLDFRLAMDYEWLLRAKAGGARFVAVDRCLSNMQGGGIGDHRWRQSQREVARARSLHVTGAGSAFAQNLYVARSLFKGSVR
ncbi:MAG: glycosyltransferase family 2 protein, partial [Burkholderiales bacterium]